MIWLTVAGLHLTNIPKTKVLDPRFYTTHLLLNTVARHRSLLSIERIYFLPISHVLWSDDLWDYVSKGIINDSLSSDASIDYHHESPGAIYRSTVTSQAQGSWKNPVHERPKWNPLTIARPHRRHEHPAQRYPHQKTIQPQPVPSLTNAASVQIQDGELCVRCRNLAAQASALPFFQVAKKGLTIAILNGKPVLN